MNCQSLHKRLDRVSPSVGATSTELVFRFFLTLVVASFPGAMIIAFIKMSFGTSIMDFIPYYDLDQFIYWGEMATFAKSGFSGGYFGVNELVSAWKGFGPHGPGIIVFYGALYRLFPWLGYAAIPVFNVGLFTLALLFYLWRMKPSFSESLSVVVGAGLYPATILYLATSYQDGLHIAAAIMLAYFFIKLIEADRRKKYFNVLYIITGLLLLSLCFIRYTWAVCWIPYFYVVIGPKPWRFCLSVVFAIGIGLVVVWIFNHFIPVWYLSYLLGGDGHPKSALDLLTKPLTYTVSNVKSLMDVTNNRPASSVIFMNLAMLVIGSLSIWVSAVKKTSSLWILCTPQREVLVTLLAGLGGLVVMFVVAWVGSGSHVVRLLSANFIFCFIVVYHFFPHKAFHALLLYEVLLMPMYLGLYQVHHYPAFQNTEAVHVIEKFKQEVTLHLKDFGSASPWDQTVVVSDVDVGVAYLGIPPGYGIQTGGAAPGGLPKYSRFALLGGGARARAIKDGELVFLMETSIGTLFFNHLEASKPNQEETTR